MFNEKTIYLNYIISASAYVALTILC